MKHLVALTIFAGALAVAGAGDSDSKTLDGTSWKLEVSPDSIAAAKGMKGFPETLSFTGGKIATVAAEKRGFPGAAYTASRSGDSGWSFTSEQKSPSEGTQSWSGTAQGDDVRGILVWTKPDRSVLTFTFRGDRRKND